MSVDVIGLRTWEHMITEDLHVKCLNESLLRIVKNGDLQLHDEDDYDSNGAIFYMKCASSIFELMLM